MLAAFRGGFDAAIDHDGEMRKFLFESIHFIVAERRDIAILFRTQTLQPGLARMYDKCVTSSGGDSVDEMRHFLIAVAVVDADAVLDRHAQRAGILHGFDA